MAKRINRLGFLGFVVAGLVLGSGTKAQLNGGRAECVEEGAQVSVAHIDTHKCYSCICKNGFVDCKNDYDCPPTDGCLMLLPQTKDGCCRKCKGCVYEGKHYSSHSEWTHPSNPCTTLRCEAGIVTESDVKCHTPCANPLKPGPGKCCPTCPECKINGQIATDDRDVISDSDDPCLQCRCSRGEMICSKRACPVLQCTPEHQFYPPGECCARCRGTRELIPVARACIFQNDLHDEGFKSHPDMCTNCICMNETSICKRFTCPILNCAPELQKNQPRTCCKKCDTPLEVRNECSYKGTSYQNGQSWKLNACQSCRCEDGINRCAMTRCNVTLPCGPGFQLVQPPDECCKKCVEVEGVCMVFGDPHYKTFDGKMYTFQGVGKYQLVSDCATQTFQIRVANELTGRFGKNSVITRRVAIRYGEHRLNLQQKMRVKLNKQRIKLPHKIDGISIDKNDDGYVALSLPNGVRLHWNGKSFLEVSVPVSMKNRVCGLCGNFNRYVQDDLKPRRKYNVTENENIFGKSWCVGRCDARRPKLASCAFHRPEKNRCKLLSNANLFGGCDSKLNYSKYYKMCKIDTCNCPSGKCHCDSLMAYARECARLGVQLPNWRQMSYCGDERKAALRRDHRRKTQHQAPFTQAQIDALMSARQRLNRTRAPVLLD